jgi:hypothetical protein
MGYDGKKKKKTHRNSSNSSEPGSTKGLTQPQIEMSSVPKCGDGLGLV